MGLDTIHLVYFANAKSQRYVFQVQREDECIDRKQFETREEALAYWDDYLKKENQE